MEKSCKFSRSPSIWMFLRTQLKSTPKWAAASVALRLGRPSLTARGATL
jgi:hypothetical protein